MGATDRRHDFRIPFPSAFPDSSPSLSRMEATIIGRLETYLWQKRCLRLMQLGGGAWTTCPGVWGDGDAPPAARMLGGYLTGVFLLQSSDCKGSKQLRATQTSPSGCYGAMGPDRRPEANGNLHIGQRRTLVMSGYPACLLQVDSVRWFWRAVGRGQLHVWRRSRWSPCRPSPWWRAIVIGRAESSPHP